MTTPPNPSPRRRRALLPWVLVGSVALNAALLAALLAPTSDEPRPLTERHVTGSTSAADKVAVVRIDGVLVEGMTGFARRQIERAARDDRVKAVVVRVDSPGGTISASEELHRLLVELRDGTSPRYKSSPKPLVVSMGTIATSGGFYVSAPAGRIVAEPTAITGSIGVYASFPNLTGFGEKNGIRWPLIKAGAVKGAGGMFSEMSPQERQTWQDMVDGAFARFKEVVEAGRPALRGKLEEPLFTRDIPIHDDKGNIVEGPAAKYIRSRADGGIFTAADALKYGLIDEIGTLDTAADRAKEAAGLTSARVVRYEPPAKTVFDLLNGDIGVSSASPGVDLRRLAVAGVPRLWYLEPRGEAAGLLAVAGAGE